MVGAHNLSPQGYRLKSHDGADLHVSRWSAGNGTSKPLLHWAHATGFHARTYEPMLKHLASSFEVHAWDMRGHGLSRDAARVSPLKGWITYYRDLTALLDAAPEPMWLAGHSIGGTASLAAAMHRPDKVKGLVLVDPVLFPLRVGLVLESARRLGLAGRIPIAAGAKRRRAVFNSRTQAFETYRRKQTFASWPDEWLHLYVEHGFIDRTDGKVELACTPEWESLSFMHTEPWASRWFKPLDCPVHILAAGKGSTFPAVAHARVKKRLPHAQIETLPDATHFLPMEYPERVVERLQELSLRTGR